MKPEWLVVKTLEGSLVVLNTEHVISLGFTQTGLSIITDKGYLECDVNVAKEIANLFMIEEVYSIVLNPESEEVHNAS